MLLNRRSFLVSAPALATIRPALQATPESGVSSGGIGLSLAEVQALYEELPVGQEYGSFAEPETGTTLFIDFEDDVATTIWVFGQLNRETLRGLIIRLCPNDARQENKFATPQYAGSMAETIVDIFRSDYFPASAARRDLIMAKYTWLPGNPAIVRDLVISVALARGPLSAQR